MQVQDGTQRNQGRSGIRGRRGIAKVSPYGAKVLDLV
jgi:hypothetical protein